ncbi:MAG: PspA-associated protein PspAA [Acidimicrobiia bacterium]
MILRIMEEGQLEVPDGALDELNDLDDNLVNAIESGDEAGFRSTLDALLARVRELGTPLPDDSLSPSELFLPAPDATIEEVRKLMDDEGLLPG